MHIRAGLTESKNRLRDARRKRRRRSEANLQLADFTQLRTPGNISGLVDLCQHQPCFVEKQPPGFAQLDTPVGAFEKTRAQFLLQRLNLLAERRLRNPQRLGCAAKMQLLGNRDEVTQMTQFHAASIKSF